MKNMKNYWDIFMGKEQVATAVETLNFNQLKVAIARLAKERGVHPSKLMARRHREVTA